MESWMRSGVVGVDLVLQADDVVCRPLVGACVRVPAGYRAVLVGPGGTRMVLGEGTQWFRARAWGRYSVRMVENRLFMVRVMAVNSTTRDGRRVSVDATLHCQVTQPEAVVQVIDPRGTVREAARSAIAQVISEIRYDDLRGRSNGNGSGYRNLASNIVRRIRTGVERTGIAVERVFLAEVQRDEPVVQGLLH